MDLRRNFKLDQGLLVNFINLSGTEKDIVRHWRNHPNIRKWMYSDRMISRREHLSFIQGLKHDKKNFYWLVKDEPQGYLGVVYLNRLDSGNRNAYLGIYVNPLDYVAHRGSKIMKALLNLAFKKIKLHKLLLEVMESNKQARSFYKKFGFVEEGKLRKMIKRQSKWQDVFVMSINSGNFNL